MRNLLLMLRLFAAVLLAGAGRLSASEIRLEAGHKQVMITTLSSDSSGCVIPFNRSGNLIVLKARVDTTEGNFILDTGAPGLVLNLTYFRSYPITMQQDGDQSGIAGSGDYIYETGVRELAFGAFRFHQLQADLSNLGNVENAKGIKVLGLLGLELFRQCEMLIDFEKSLLYLHRVGKKEPVCGHRFFSNPSQYTVYPIEYSGKRMITTTQVAGKKLKLVIDCAAEANIIDSRLPEKILETITISRRVKLSGIGERKADGLYGNLSAMTMGAEQFTNLPVIIINLAYTCFGSDLCVNGVLGFEFLSQRKLGFNFVTRKMYRWK